MYPSLTYATGKDNSRTEALGKAFFCLYVASVCATGLTCSPFTAHRIFMDKKLPLQYYSLYLLIYFENVYLFCVVLVHSTKALTLYEELLLKTMSTRWGDCGTLAIETHVFHLCDTQLLLALTMVEIICLHLSIEKEPLGLNS